MKKLEKQNKGKDFYAREEIPERAYSGTHKTVLKMIKKMGPGKLLDISGGTGNFAKLVSDEWNQKVYVTELKKEYITETGLEVAEVDLNSDPLPYPDNCFDYITCVEVLAHLRNPWFSIQEISRVLKPGGVLILTTPNIHNLRSKRHFVFKNVFPMFETETNFNAVNHLHPFSLTELKLILNENDFSVQDISYGKGYRQRVFWSHYQKNKKSRSLLRNIAGYLIRNIFYFFTKLISFFCFGSFSTKNAFFAVTTFIVAKKND